MIDTDGGHCGYCGTPLPEGCNLRREYCNAKCRGMFYTAQDRAERIAERQGRKCLWCSGPIPAEARNDVIYCRKACSNQSQRDIARKRNKRNCAHCGAAFFAMGPQKYCTHACYIVARFG